MRNCIFLALILIMSSCKKESIGLETDTNPSGALLKRTLLYGSLEDKNPLSVTEEFEYDPHGILIKTLSPLYNNGKMVGVSRYALYDYNASGQLTNIATYNANLYVGFLNLKNHTFTYNAAGQKDLERIEYPQINSTEMIKYFYQKNQLVKSEKYNNQGKLESYTIYQNSGDKVINETLYQANNEVNTITKYTYTNGLNTKIEVYRGNKAADKLREITKNYDSNGNLTLYQSQELSLSSSASSFVLRYEYY